MSEPKATRAPDYQRVFADEVTVQGRGPEIVGLTFSVLEQWHSQQSPTKLQLFTVYLPRGTAVAVGEILLRLSAPETPGVMPNGPQAN